MHRRILRVPLAIAATMYLSTAPAAGADDNECGIILPVADQLQTALNQVSPSGAPSWAAGPIRRAISPLHGLRSPAAIDLRLRSDMLASQIDNLDPFRPATADQFTSDLAKVNEQLATAREYCAP
jgi:hypothetical protein